MDRTSPEPAYMGPVAVVAYARMSSDVQDHSIRHQFDRVQAYAAAQGMVIVRIFLDEGRSCLLLATRPGARFFGHPGLRREPMGAVSGHRRARVL